MMATALLGHEGVPLSEAASLARSNPHPHPHPNPTPSPKPNPNPDQASLTRSHPDAPPLAMMVLTLGASLLFYPAMYLGAALGNSHPLAYAVPGHPLLSLSAMVAEQEVLQTTLGKGLGMMFCRMALGDPAKVSSLGQVFAAIMLAQGAVLALGWEPRKTLGRIAECFR